MLIQCTKKLLAKLKIQPEKEIENVEALYAWHANILTFNRKSTIVFVNDSNRYIIVLHGLYAKDFKKLNELFTEAIRIVFRAEKIKPELIEQYIKQSPTFAYTKTRDRTSVARMNQSIDAIHYMMDLLDDEKIIQPIISLKMSRILITHGAKNYIHPYEELANDFKSL